MSKFVDVEVVNDDAEAQETAMEVHAGDAIDVSDLPKPTFRMSPFASNVRKTGKMVADGIALLDGVGDSARMIILSVRKLTWVSYDSVQSGGKWLPRAKYDTKAEALAAGELLVKSGGKLPTCVPEMAVEALIENESGGFLIDGRNWTNVTVTLGKKDYRMVGEVYVDKSLQGRTRPGFEPFMAEYNLTIWEDKNNIYWLKATCPVMHSPDDQFVKELRDIFGI